MNELLVFFLIAFLSFIGSLQPGPVNLGVFYFALHQKIKQAIFVSIGGSLPELIYCFIAFRFNRWLQVRIPQLEESLHWFNPVLLLVGLYLFFTKGKEEVDKQVGENYAVGKGFLLGLFNPQLLLFWLAMAALISQYTEYISLSTMYSFLAAAIGAGIGAFGSHLFFIFLISKWQQSKLLMQMKQNSQTVLGLVLALIGLLGILHASFNG